MENYHPFDDAFDELVEKDLQKWHVPGISLAVVDKTSTYFKSYGYANLAKKIKPNEHTLWYAASTTKAQLTAVWAIYLSSPANQNKPESERITWRTPLATIMPEDFVLDNAIRTQQVTLEDSLTGRTGFPRHDAAYGHDEVQDERDIVRNLRNLPFHHDLRTDWEYCNLMYITASYALEVVTGKSLASLLHELLWTPLDMQSTYAGSIETREALEKDRSKVLATGYTWTPNGTFTERPEQNMRGVSGAGYVVSTAADYAKYMHGLLGTTTSTSNDENNSVDPLPPNIVHDLWTPRMIVHNRDRTVPYSGIVAYCLGWFRATYRGHDVLWHTGGSAGSGSFILVVPVLGWGVAFFANEDAVSGSLRGLGFALLDQKLGADGKWDGCGTWESEYEGWRREAEEEYREKLENAEIDRSPAMEALVKLHAGTYRHPGYGRIVLRVVQGEDEGHFLRAQVDDRRWDFTIELRPIKADDSGKGVRSWFVSIFDISVSPPDVVHAVSRIGADGRVEGIGIGMEPSMPRTLIQFDRVD